MVTDFIFLGSKITADGDCSHEIKRRLLLGRKVITNLDSIFKSIDITLPTKVCLVKAMVPLTWLEGDWGPRGKRQGAAGRPQHWGHRREELGQGQLPQALGPALGLTPEHPHPVWNHRDHLEHLGRQKGQSGLRRIGISGLVPSPPERHLPPLP